MFVFRGQGDRPAGLLKGLLGGVGAKQGLGADRTRNRRFRRGGGELIANAHGADKIAGMQRGNRLIDQIADFRVIHDSTPRSRHTADGTRRGCDFFRFYIVAATILQIITTSARLILLVLPLEAILAKQAAKVHDGK